MKGGRNAVTMQDQGKRDARTPFTPLAALVRHARHEARRYCDVGCTVVSAYHGGAAEQPDAADERRNSSAVRRSLLICVFDGPSGARYHVAQRGWNRMKYKVVLQRSEEGVAASVPGLPGCWSQGETEGEALENIRSAIEEYLAVVTEQIQGADVREVEVFV